MVDSNTDSSDPRTGLTGPRIISALKQHPQKCCRNPSCKGAPDPRRRWVLQRLVGMCGAAEWPSLDEIYNDTCLTMTMAVLFRTVQITVCTTPWGESANGLVPRGGCRYVVGNVNGYTRSSCDRVLLNGPEWDLGRLKRMSAVTRSRVIRALAGYAPVVSVPLLEVCLSV
jgi:hypothetical protein